MPVSVFDDWYNHYTDQPWGYEFELANHCEKMAYLTNGLFKLKEPVKPIDFYPKKINDEEPEELDWKHLKSQFKTRSNTSG